MDDFQNKSQLKKTGSKEVDPLLAPSIIPRPRYELVLTGDNDRWYTRSSTCLPDLADNSVLILQNNHESLGSLLQ
jgi:hypothetical protein